MAISVDLDETPGFAASHQGLYPVLRPVRSNTYRKVQHMVRVMLRQTGKIMTKSSEITNQLSIILAGLIIDYLSALMSQLYTEGTTRRYEEETLT